MKRCIDKQGLRCIYLTKDNYRELLEEDYPMVLDKDSGKYSINLKIEDDKIIIESYGEYTSEEYKLNTWYVEEPMGYDYPIWVSYTEDQFNEIYELKEEF